MKKPQIYDSYPLWIVAIVVLFMLAAYIAGLFIMFKLSLVTGLLYILFMLLWEFKLFKESCVHCCYYGKLCAFGRGAVAALLFKKGDPKKFCEKKISFKDLIPQILLSLIPMLVGIALLVSRGFDLLILIATIYPLISWFVLNPIIYGKLTCLHCKQGSICCPALKYFSRK